MGAYAQSIANTVGGLAVQINGAGEVKITGPGFNESIKYSSELYGLRPGVYTIAAKKFQFGRPDKPNCSIRTPARLTQKKSIVVNQTARVIVTYTDDECGGS
jgi:hypothetical protein